MSHKQKQQLIDLANSYANADDQAEANYYLYSYDPENYNHLGGHNKTAFKPTIFELVRTFFPLYKRGTTLLSTLRINNNKEEK